MIIGYTMLHYGVDYLACALESLRPYVDRHVIIYSETPTFGSFTDLPCPDSRDDLLKIARDVLGKKLNWLEGIQQGYPTLESLYPNANLIIELDADEVMPSGLIGDILRRHRKNELTTHYYRLPMIHHWRSFNFVCRDASWPVRLCVPTSGDGDTRFFNNAAAPIHHFGYARSIADTQYKIATSAHRGEWRDGWWENKFLKFPEDLTDLHPVSIGLWNAEPFDRNLLPEVMKKHPNWDKEVIQ